MDFTRLRLPAALVLAVLAAAAGKACWKAGAQLAAQSSSAHSSPRLTAERLRESGWWPTRGDAARKDYAGTEVCAECHQDEVRIQQATSMARAASKAQDTALLRSQANLSSKQPPFLTSITRGRQGSTYTVARGGEAIGGQLAWTMGDGTMGQTFLLQANGDLFESQLSYYSSISALDLTPGHVPAPPGDLDRAFGKRMEPEEVRQCFACHTTASTSRGQLDPSHATPGVTCEACHGPGAKHVAAMRQSRVQEGDAAILRPELFDPVKLIDYCGACHRAPLDVAATRDRSAINVRFQPYRLARSRCWSRPDRRIACTACHDPHEQVVRGVTAYDAKCLACHAVKQDLSAALKPEPGKQPACPVSAEKCVSCHMPKYTVPQMHGSFTDHNIRVVRPGEPFPL